MYSSDWLRFNTSGSACFGLPKRVRSVCHLRQHPTRYSRFVMSAGSPANTVNATGFFSASSSSTICAGSSDSRATIALSRLSSSKRKVPSTSAPPASSTNSSCSVYKYVVDQLLDSARDCESVTCRIREMVPDSHCGYGMLRWAAADDEDGCGFCVGIGETLG